jgi:multidrug efflux system membrane fusion protein
VQTRSFIVLFSLGVLAVTAACSDSAATSGGGGGRGRGRGGEGGAVPVVTTKVVQRDVPVDIAAIGNVEAYTMISVRSQVTGTIESATFHEGDFVKKDQLLFTIDKRPFEAALRQAEANLVRDQALLSQAEAQLGRDGSQSEYATLTAQRQAQLAEKGIVSKDVAEQARAAADTSAGTIKADRAAVESAKAQLVAQQAMVDNARVQLGYTSITSPIDGHSSNIAVKVGGLVTANQTELTTIAQVEPIFVTFSIPAANLASIKNNLGKAKIPVTATSQDSTANVVEGELNFIDNVIDASTDTIKLKARFENHDRRLWPGQFARVSLRVAMIPNAMVLPSQAVQTGQEGQFVFLVKPDNTVAQQAVTIGQRMGDDVVVQKGLQSGQTVVTEGQLRLEAGTKIQTADGRGGGRRGGGRGQGQGSQGSQGGQNGQTGQSGENKDAQGQARGRRGE